MKNGKQTKMKVRTVKYYVKRKIIAFIETLAFDGGDC